MAFGKQLLMKPFGPVCAARLQMGGFDYRDYAF